MARRVAQLTDLLCDAGDAVGSADSIHHRAPRAQCSEPHLGRPHLLGGGWGGRGNRHELQYGGEHRVRRDEWPADLPATQRRRIIELVFHIELVVDFDLCYVSAFVCHCFFVIVEFVHRPLPRRWQTKFVLAWRYE